MSLTDPQNFEYPSTVFTDLNRIESVGQSSVYSSADEAKGMMISHQKTKKRRKRTLCKFSDTRIVTNPLNSDDSHYDSGVVNISFDFPEYGYTDAEKIALAEAAFAHLSSALLGSLFGGEH